MASLKHLLFLFTLLVFLVACSPSPDLLEEPDAHQDAAETPTFPETSNSSLPEKSQRDTRIYVTITCRRGTIPGTNVTTMPIRAYVSMVDEKHLEGLSAALGRGEGSNFFIAEYTDDNGVIDIHLNENRKYDIAVMILENDLNITADEISNYAWGSMKVQKGSTVHKNFYMTQPWCDKDREIRDIDPTSYNIQPLDFSPDYDDNRVTEHGVNKLVYYRANDSGSFKYYANYRSKLNGKKVGLHLENGANSMVITNVQSEYRIKRVCSEKGNLDMTIKSDGALGIQAYSGTADNKIINCIQSYSTYYPFTYAKSYDGVTATDIELSLRHVDTDSILARTTCPNDIDAIMNSAPVAYASSCLESAITHTNVFERDPSASKAFPWGKLHQYSVRSDLTKLEEEKGKVPPTLLP